jgi:hypothetical protein
MWMKPVLSIPQKRALVVLTLLLVWSNTHVHSDGFLSWQGFPFTFHKDSDAGHLMYDRRMLVADIAIAIGVAVLFIVSCAVFWRSSKAQASVLQVLVLAAFSAAYFWANTTIWSGWPMSWIWNSQTHTLGFPFACEGASGAMRLGTAWTTVPNLVIGFVCYRAIDHGFRRIQNR